jgi:regulator of replication initiation timing
MFNPPSPQVRQMLEEGRAESSRLREENAALREENARLRAPLGAIGLQRWEGVA